jgi:hypothetical protein
LKILIQSPPSNETKNPVWTQGADYNDTLFILPKI